MGWCDRVRTLMAAQTQRVASSELIPPPPAPHTPSVAKIKNVQLSSSGTWWVWQRKKSLVSSLGFGSARAASHSSNSHTHS
jgi:hypothetical protein